MNLYNYYTKPTELNGYSESTVKVPELAYHHAQKIIKGRWIEGEAAISKDPLTAYQYANYILKRRFARGEPSIARDPTYAYFYAHDVIKGRFPEGEFAINSGPHSKDYYAMVNKMEKEARIEANQKRERDDSDFQ